MNRIRIGVVGLRFGQHHVRTLANMDEAQLVAVADRHFGLPGGLEAYAARYGARAYHDGVEMIEAEELDALSICASPRGREALLEHGARKGLALFVEKPWASDLADAQRLAQVCVAHDATVMVGFSFRFHPAIAQLRELIDAELGAPWLLNGEYLFNWRPPDDSWLWDPANGNGFFNENSCHLFDAVCYLLGNPTWLTAEAINPLGTPAEHAAVVTLRFESGAVAALTVGGIGTGAMRAFPRLDLVAAHGQAHLTGHDHVWDQLSWCTRGESALRSILRPPEALGKTRYTDAFGHFFHCIRTGQRPSVGVKDGVRAVAIAMAVTESARTGRRVALSW